MIGSTRKLGVLVGMATLGVAVVGTAPAGAVVPTVPLGCQQQTTTFSNTTPLLISDLDVRSRDIVVAGVAGPIWDVEVVTDLTHTSNIDVDMTLRSPTGTLVTLTTDNGTFAVDGFDGTRWDDQAQHPVTDESFVSGVPEPTLSPEEPLSAFSGEDPNGVWTLAIADDELDDTGTLGVWSLDITTFGGPLLTYPAVSVNPTDVPIPDGAGFVQSTVTITAIPYVVDVDVLASITHPFPGDLSVLLTPPAGTEVLLTSDDAGGADNAFVGTIFDDDADPDGQVPYTNNDGMVTDHLYVANTPVARLTPEEPLGAFRGEDPNGTWTLTVADDDVNDVGTQLDFGLQVVGGTCSPVTDPPPVPEPLPEPPAPVPPTGDDVTVTSGPDRVGTAIEVSKESFGDDAASAVVVARRDAFPDALAGTPLAAAEGGPMLLSSTDALEPAVEAEIARVLPDGGDVYLLGGPSALGPNVGNRLAGLGYAVHRIAGADRFETAVAIAETLGSPRTVFEASGLDFPDAMSAGGRRHRRRQRDPADRRGVAVGGDRGVPGGQPGRRPVRHRWSGGGRRSGRHRPGRLRPVRDLGDGGDAVLPVADGRRCGIGTVVPGRLDRWCAGRFPGRPDAADRAR